MPEFELSGPVRIASDDPRLEALREMEEAEGVDGPDVSGGVGPDTNPLSDNTIFCCSCNGGDAEAASEWADVAERGDLGEMNLRELVELARESRKR